jgi:hypothetical protein
VCLERTKIFKNEFKIQTFCIQINVCFFVLQW